MAATYTVKQVAQILGYSTNSIYTFLKEKRIKGVRVGTGRFRIPQSELDRLLMIKNPKGSVPLTLSDASLTPVADTKKEGVQEAIVLPDVRLPFFAASIVAVPNIFDWFVGIAGIIAGIAMFLFNRSFDTTAFWQISPVVMIMRILFIGGGLGVLLTNIFDDGRGIWRKVFRLLLAVSGAGAAYVMARALDMDGMVIYGSLSIALFMETVFPLGGISTFAAFLSMLAVGLSVVPLLWPQAPHIVTLVDMVHIAPATIGTVLLAASSVLVVIVWWGYLKNRRIFWLTTWTAAFVAFLFAFFYAHGQYWSRSFLFIVIGLTSLFLSPWERISTTKYRNERLLSYMILMGLLTVLLLGVATVYLMQMNVTQTVTQENSHKVGYAKLLTESVFEGIQSTLVGTAANPDLLTAIKKHNAEEIGQISRLIYESNKNIERIAVLDSAGDWISLYPYGTFDQKNLAFREYFIAARDTKKPYISNIFTSLADGSNQKIVVIAVPILGKGNTFEGVLVSSVNLLAMGAHIQTIAVPERGEYFVIADSKGQYVIPPVGVDVGAVVDKAEPVRLGADGKQGSSNGKTTDGIRTIVNYDSIPSLHWGIALETPLTHIYQLTAFANLSVFGVVIAGIMVATIVLQGMHLYWRAKRQDGSGP